MPHLRVHERVMRLPNPLPLLVLALVLSDCAQVIVPTEDPPDWPCHIGVWTCGADEASMTFECVPCNNAPMPEATYGIHQCLDVFERCVSHAVYAILPTGRMVTWVIDVSRTHRRVAYMRTTNFWQWRLVGQSLEFSDPEHYRYPGTTCTQRPCAVPSMRGRVDASACSGDTFDALAAQLSDEFIELAVGRALPEVTPETLRRPRICRRLEPALALAFMRQVNLDTYNQSSSPPTGTPY